MTRISEIQDRVDAATPGPWENFPLDWRCVVDPHNDSICDLHTGGEIADATFIAHARADVPLLLAEVKKLRDVVELAINHCCVECLAKAARAALSEGEGT
jgi:hypothetical protein